MYTWNYEHWIARKGEWEQIARDHERFQMKIQDIGSIISTVLKDDHRRKILERRELEMNLK